MDNFDLTKFLSEGKLHEALDPQDVVDIADTVAEEFTKESADEGDFLIYTVGRMDGMDFELDTDTSAQSPDSIDPMGVGEGWGGMFSINPAGEGYEVRNAEKGGLVAIIDNMGNFRMLSADESRAEMGRAKGEETDYMERRRETDDYMEEGEEEVKEIKSNKMKKSELKEMIKAAMSENARTDAEEEGYLDGMRDEKEDMKEAEDVEVEDDENIDVDVEKDVDVKVDDEESEVDVDVKASMPGESEDVEEVQALLMKAQEAAQAFGDEKLMDQIGNTITYFTRSHVAGNVSEMDDMDVNVNTTEMEAEMGLEEAVSGDQEVILKGEFKADDETFNKLSDYKKGMKVVMRRAGMDMAKDYDRYAGVIDSIDQGNNEIVFTNAKGAKMALDPADAIIVTNWGGPNESLNESVMFPMWNKIK